MKQKNWKRYMAAALVIMLAVCTYVGAGKAAAATTRLQSIEAEYFGEPLEVGERINLKDISVLATYKIYDGSDSYEDVEEIRSGYTINPATVKREGTNKVTVTYQGKTDTIEVPGKSLESITAEYLGEAVYIGTPVASAKVEVIAYFDDGSEKRVKDFKLSDATVTKKGTNIFTVTYEGKKATFEVEGKEPLAVVDIEAEYTGEPLYVGDTISKSDIKVTLTYNDEEMDPKDAGTNFTISPSIVEDVGENTIIVSYGGVSTEVEVTGVEKLVEKLIVEYIGPGVLIGEHVKKEEFLVTVVYEDKSEVPTKDFELYDTKIEFEENMIFVSCAGETEAVFVPGVKGFAGNFDNPLSAYMFGTTTYTEVTLGMNMDVEKNKFFLRALDRKEMEPLVRKVIPTSEFIAFEVTYDDDEMVREFPMAMKVTVPSNYDVDKFGVYYTPNKSTIMAKVDGKFTDDSKTEYQFAVYEAGAYILVNEVPQSLVKEIIIDNKLTLKVNRNFTLKPQVYPSSAENKELTFWTSDAEVATISSNGNIKTLKEGVCSILIHAADNGGAYTIITLVVE